MEYQELICAIADETNYTRREVRKILRLLARTIQDNVRSGRDVQIDGVGRFKNVPASQRVGRHPVTGKRIDIPATRRVKFIPSEGLKRALQDSLEVFKEEDLAEKFGLTKEVTDARPEGRRGDRQVRSGDRSRPRRKGKAGRKGGLRRRPSVQRPARPEEGD